MTQTEKQVHPSGEQLYMLVHSRFKNGYFPYSMVSESGKKAWEAAAADLVWADGTIMAKYGSN